MTDRKWKATDIHQCCNKCGSFHLLADGSCFDCHRGDRSKCPSCGSPGRNMHGGKYKGQWFSYPCGASWGQYATYAHDLDSPACKEIASASSEISALRRALWDAADTLEVASSMIERAQGRPVWKRGRNAVAEMRRLARNEAADV